MKKLVNISINKLNYFMIVILLVGIISKTFSQSQNLNSNQTILNDNEIVANFMKPLNVVIPDKWISFAVDAIKLFDNEGVVSAHMILQEDLPKVAVVDRPAYVLMAFDAIRTAYDKEKHTKASDEFFAEYLNYENGVKSVTNRFAQDYAKRSEEFIAKTKQETAQIKQETAQTKQETAQNKLEIENMVKKAINILSSDPNNTTARKILQTASDTFKKAHQEPSEDLKKYFKIYNIE